MTHKENQNFSKIINYLEYIQFKIYYQNSFSSFIVFLQLNALNENLIKYFFLLFRMELEQLEREKREREMRELRERELNDRIKDEIIKNAAAAAAAGGGAPRMPNPLDSHWLELHRRYPQGGPQGGPPPLHQFTLYPGPAPPSQAALTQLERERLERLGNLNNNKFSNNALYL